MITIRAFRGDDADYAAYAAVRNAVFPEYPYTAAELRSFDEKRDARCFYARVLVEIDGQIVGEAHIGHMAWMFNPQIFDLGVYVHPEYRRRGAGSLLYQQLLATVAKFEPRAFLHEVREDYSDGVRFAQQRGFGEERRIWESRLNVRAFDPSRFTGAIERAEASGISFTTAAELIGRDESFWHQLHTLDTTVTDVPSPEPLTPPDFATWIKYFDSPNFIPEGMFIARDGERIVGSSSLWRRESSNELDTGFTGVYPQYRRRGIALALKLQAINYANQVGAPIIRTENDATNRGMLSINELLGFVKQPAWLTMRSEQVPQL